MLVTFETRAYPPITMLGDVAIPLLKHMGMSGDVPGAIKAVDINEALDRLRIGVAAFEQQQNADDEPANSDEEPPVSLSVRAFPLMELLAIAADQGCNVIWRERQ